MKPVLRLRIWLLITTLLGSLSFAGCTRHVYVSKEMTWECAPEHDTPQYPTAQAVRFKFIESPGHEEVVSGGGLCDQLRSSGKKVVLVEYDTWGNFYRGLIGFHEVSVDGTPIVNVGGWGSSGAKEGAGQHPLEKIYGLPQK